MERGKLRRNKRKGKRKASKVDLRRKKSWNVCFSSHEGQRRRVLCFDKNTGNNARVSKSLASLEMFSLSTTMTAETRSIRGCKKKKNFLSLVRNRSSGDIICAIFNARRRGYFESIEAPTFRPRFFSSRWIAQIYLLRLMSPFKRNERD